MWKGRYRGQTQRWFLMRFLGDDGLVDIAAGRPSSAPGPGCEPEDLVERIVPFKRATYAAVLAAFRPFLSR